jgi:demethylmenaquinone methyltransferase/2-methoxy-6-polyprenyl-1,4-benzoquinol methylase
MGERSAPQARTFFGDREVPAEAKQGLVDEVFHRVARRYDLMNDLMSGGVHRFWKDALVSMLAPPRHGARPFEALDIAGGTGDIAFRIVRRSDGHARVVVTDINPSMLAVGRDRARARGLDDAIAFVEGNAEALPFPDGRFDAATIAFGIRNVARIDTALGEAYRVLKHGGRFLCLEFSSVDVAWLDSLYDAYSHYIIPAMGRVVAGDEDSYRYLVESIRRFPNQARFAAMLKSAGFERVTWRNLSGGIVAVHSGWKL